MVSRRNFAAITMIMAIVLFLFQGLNMAKEKLNHYETNTYVKNEEELPDSSEAFGTKGDSGKVNVEGSRGTIVYIGKNADDSVGAVVSEWCKYVKYESTVYSSVAKYEKAMEKKDAKKPEMLIVNSESIDWTTLKDIIELQKCAEDGINLVFANLPDVSFIKKNQNLRELLGIQKITADEVTVKGLDLYAELMLGGENIYEAKKKEEKKMEDLALTFPWFKLGDGTKAYMKGIPEDSTLKVQEHPVLIWRKSMGNSYVFAVNGDYMEDEAGLGILTGMLYETRDYLIYPVVNAQNLIMANFPGLAEENTAQMQEIYGNTASAVNRDIVWPSVISSYEKSHLGLTCMLAPKLDYDNAAKPDGTMMNYYVKMINEEKGETGLSGIGESDTEIAQKLQEDQRFMEKNLGTFSFSSFYSGERTEEEIKEALQQPILEQVRTVVKDQDMEGDIVGYQNKNITNQKVVTEESDQFTYRSWLKVKSVESALGYTSVLLDLDNVIYPKTEDDRWEKIVKNFSAKLATYWQPFSGFDGTTASECDSRIRTFLNSRYEDEREDNTITLKTTGTDAAAYYVLRTHNETVRKVTGGTAEKLEDSAWLIRAEQSEVTITLGSADQRYYYEKGAKNK